MRERRESRDRREKRENKYRRDHTERRYIIFLKLINRPIMEKRFVKESFI